MVLFWASLAALVVLIVFLLLRSSFWHGQRPKTSFLGRFQNIIGRIIVISRLSLGYVWIQSRHHDSVQKCTQICGQKCTEQLVPESVPEDVPRHFGSKTIRKRRGTSSGTLPGTSSGTSPGTLLKHTRGTSSAPIYSASICALPKTEGYYLYTRTHDSGRAWIQVGD